MAHGEKEEVLVHERQKLKEINETNTSETFTQRQILFGEKNAWDIMIETNSSSPLSDPKLSLPGLKLSLSDL